VLDHLIQRGNNRQVIFVSDGDMKAYVTWLKDYAQQFNVVIHAWVWMTNHVHILPMSITQLATAFSTSSIAESRFNKDKQYNYKIHSQ
jgi:REP element-mobilizing transposase RayT